MNFPAMLFWVLTVLLSVVIYFLPSLVARKKKRQDAIIVLNLFLGWTVLGWIGALIWAMCESPVQAAKAS
jgi:hypothetical protein